MKVQNTLVLALTAIACAPCHVLAEGQRTRQLKGTKTQSEKMPKATKSPSEKGTKATRQLKATKTTSEKIPKATKSPSEKGTKATRQLKATKTPSENGTKVTKTPKTTKSPSENGTKATKAPKMPKLEACLSTFGEAAGSLPDVMGKVTVNFDETKITFKASLKDAAPNCETCGIHIHTGTSCETSVAQGGHYWIGVDPWTTAGGAIYTSDYKGKGKANFMLDAGTTYEDNIGKVVVVHDMYSARYACGVLTTKRAKGCKK